MSYASEIKQIRGALGELLASHEQTRDLAQFGKYDADPIGFMHEVLQCDPWDKQIEMAESVRDNGRTIVVTCNGAGKDWCTARIALWWVYARAGMVILTGPTERQVKQILMREVRRAFAAVSDLPGDLYSLDLRVGADSGILAFTSDNADKLVGFHHPRLLICVTEGQGVEDAAYEAALACATGPENRIFVYGNPTSPKGPFYRAATGDKWATINIPASLHPNVITGKNEIPGAVSREWIEMMRDEYGEASPIYRSRVLAQFPEESIEGLVRRDWVRAAFAKHESGELEEEARNHPYTLALDVARYGADKSVLAVIQGPIVRRLITWGQTSITETCDRVRRVVDELTNNEFIPPEDRKRCSIVVDAPGIGGGAVDVLRLTEKSVHEFNGGSTPVGANSSRFFNQRAQSHWMLRKLLEDGRVAMPQDAMLEEEALAVEWHTNAGGQIQILAKDTIRATLGRSPDRLDAVVIGLAHSMGEMRAATRFVRAYTPGAGAW